MLPATAKITTALNAVDAYLEGNRPPHRAIDLP
jgi:hypothetical protein